MCVCILCVSLIRTVFLNPANDSVLRHFDFGAAVIIPNSNPLWNGIETFQVWLDLSLIRLIHFEFRSGMGILNTGSGPGLARQSP